MPDAQDSPYIDAREGGYYVAGTRISLDIVVRDFQAGMSPEAILENYPSIGSLAKVYGTLTFILEHPMEVDAYLRDQDRLWEELQKQHPMPEDAVQRFYRARELFRKSA